MKPYTYHGVDYNLLSVEEFEAAIAELTREAESIPLPEGEEFFDALEDFRGPEITAEEMDWSVSDADYEAWLARRSEKLKRQTARDHEVETRAKTLAFYMDEDNILNERSLWED